MTGLHFAFHYSNRPYYNTVNLNFIYLSHWLKYSYKNQNFVIQLTKTLIIAVAGNRDILTLNAVAAFSSSQMTWALTWSKIELQPLWVLNPISELDRSCSAILYLYYIYIIYILYRYIVLNYLLGKVCSNSCCLKIAESNSLQGLSRVKS